MADAGKEQLLDNPIPEVTGTEPTVPTPGKGTLEASGGDHAGPAQRGTEAARPAPQPDSVKAAFAGKAGEEAGAAPKPAAGPAAGVVLTEDPKYAVAGALKWFQDQVKAKVTGWGLAFDPATVTLGQADGKAAILLGWNAAWGGKPTIHIIPFNMAPIDARCAVTALTALPGWAKIDRKDEPVVRALVEGQENVLGAAVRGKLRGTFAALKAETPEKQAKALEAATHVKAAMGNWEPEPMTKTVATVTVGAPKEVKNYAFVGKTQDAEEYEAKYSDAVKFPIFTPKGATPGFHNHPVNDIAHDAAYMPKEARKVIKRVLLNPVQNPEDAHWAQVYHTPNFQSYMTAGADGIVTIYPMKTAQKLQDANSQRSAMVHETGHTWSYTHWGNDETKNGWVGWKKAMEADRTAVSGYATNAIAEDVAETIRIYVSTKGSPRHAEYEKIVPHRFAILKKDYDK